MRTQKSGWRIFLREVGTESSQEADETGLCCPAGGVSPLSFAEAVSADEDDRTLNQGRHKKKGNKLVEEKELEKEKGEPRSSTWRGRRRRRRAQTALGERGGWAQGFLGQGRAAA